MSHRPIDLFEIKIKGKRLIHKPGQQQNRYVSIEEEGIVFNEVICKQE